MTIRVVLADDHPMYRYGLTAILEQAEAIDVVASVGDGAALVSAVRELSPDVVLTDLSMPDLDGVTAITQLLRAQPELPILVLTMHEDDAHVFAALRAGARGYLVKRSDGEEIVRAVVPSPLVARFTAVPSRGGSSRSTPVVRSSRPPLGPFRI
jgi:DNA-binding NarL/FixJ family response regulator